VKKKGPCRERNRPEESNEPDRKAGSFRVSRNFIRKRGAEGRGELLQKNFNMINSRTPRNERKRVTNEKLYVQSENAGSGERFPSECRGRDLLIAEMAFGESGRRGRWEDRTGSGMTS